jgi:tetratricopeptide (TPR) repeat protein
VFPGCTLWVGNNCVNRHALLIGRKDGNDVIIDFSFIKQAIQREWIREELAEIRMFTVYDVIDSFMLNGETIDEFTKGADINTDEHPVLEYRSPTTLETDPMLLAGNISDMLKIRSNVYENLTNVSAEEKLVVKKALDLFMEGTAYIYAGHVSDIMDAYGGVVQNYVKAAEANALDLDGVYLIRDMEERERVLFERYVKEEATSSELIELSVLNLKLGEIRKATQSLEQVLKRDPRNLSVLYSLFVIYQNLSDEENQVRILDMLVEVDNNPDVFFQKGLFLGREGKYDESTLLFEKAIRVKEDSAKYHFYLGLSLQNLGDEAMRRDVRLGYYREALKSYERAKELDVQNEFSVDEYIVPLKYEVSANR